MKKGFIILALLVTGIATIYAGTNQHSIDLDSLRLAIELAPKNDTTRLAAIKELARIRQSTEEGLALAQELFHESPKLQSNKYFVFGGYYSLLYYSNRQQVDSVKYYSEQVLPVAEKEKMWVVYFDILKLRTYSYCIEENFELAINEGLAMYEKAKEFNYPNGLISANTVLALTYLATERWAEGLEHLEEAYKYAIETDNHHVSIDVLSMLISASFQQGEYEQLYRYINEFKNELKEFLKVLPFSDTFYNYYAFADIYLAYYYLRTNNDEEAMKHLQAAKVNLNKNHYLMYELLYHDAMAEYYQKKKINDKAMAHIDSTLAPLKGVFLADYYKQLVKKANMYIDNKNYAESIPLFRESVLGKDSLMQTLANKQMEQIQEIYNLNQFYLEKEQLKNEQHTIILILILVGIVLLIVFTVRSVFVRKKLKESESSMREATMLANEANEIKDRFLSNLSYNIRTPLNNVVGFSQLMSMDADMDEQQRKEYGAIIQKNSEELMSLVNNVLDLSRLESGMMKFNIGKQTIDDLWLNVQYISKNQNNGLITISFTNNARDVEFETDSSRFIQTLVSMLTYPHPCEETREISLTVDKDASANALKFTVSNTPLADPAFAAQEVSIRNEINRLFIEHFKGTYQLNPKNSLPNTIVFTYPVG